jgi:hypothetical protein
MFVVIKITCTVLLHIKEQLISVDEVKGSSFFRLFGTLKHCGKNAEF